MVPSHATEAEDSKTTQDELRQNKTRRLANTLHLSYTAREISSLSTTDGLREKEAQTSLVSSREEIQGGKRQMRVPSQEASFSATEVAIHEELQWKAPLHPAAAPRRALRRITSHVRTTHRSTRSVCPREWTVREAELNHYY